MVPFALVATLLGVVLGLRFTMIVLVPAMSFALIIAGAMVITSGGSFGATIMGLTLFLICLQAGYLGGAAVRSSLFASINRAWRLPLRPRPHESVRVERP